MGTISEKAMTQGAAVQRAPVLAPDLATKAVVDIASIDASTTAAATPAAPAQQKRLLMELKQVASGAASVWMHSGEGVHVFPAADNLSFWRALIEGPPSSPFEHGVFALNVVMPSTYPMRPPPNTIFFLVVGETPRVISVTRC